MHEVPLDLLYSAEHHWVRVLGPVGEADAAAGGSAGSADDAMVLLRWGLTAHARHHLGELVAATLPAAGALLEREEVYGEVECTTTVADLFAPLSATVTASNEALAASPELLDADPYGEGWLLTVAVPAAPGAGSQGALMDARAYRALVAAPDPRVGAGGAGRALQ